MKNFILTLAVLTSGSFLAQENNVQVDFIEKTKELSIVAQKDGEIIAKNVKVITFKETDVRLNPDHKYQLNQKRIETPVSVTKVIMIDEDNDAFYDRAIKVDYSLPVGTPLLEENNLNIAKIVNNFNEDNLEDKDYTGEGYFNQSGEYVAKFYEEDELNSVILK